MVTALLAAAVAAAVAATRLVLLGAREVLRVALSLLPGAGWLAGVAPSVVVLSHVRIPLAVKSSVAGH
jgi:hypothetical protein